MKLDIKIIAILVLVGVVVFQQCGGEKKEKGETIKIDGKDYEILKHKIDTVEVEKTKIIYKKGKDIYHETVRTVEIPRGPIDTLTILKDFYSKNIYKDTIKLDDNLGTVIVIDTITRNQLDGRFFKANIVQRTINDQLIVKEPPKIQAFYGPFISIDRVDLINAVGGSVILKTKEDKMYQIGVGINGSQMRPFIQGGMYWKIRLKK
jgi:hypothetical protein